MSLKVRQINFLISFLSRCPLVSQSTVAFEECQQFLLKICLNQDIQQMVELHTNKKTVLFPWGTLQ